MAITPQERYLNNPHITLDDKRRHQLGLDTQEISDGEAVVLPIEKVQSNKEVIVRKKTNAKRRKSTIETTVSGGQMSSTDN